MNINIITHYGFYGWCYAGYGCVKSIPKHGYDRKNINVYMTPSYKHVTTIHISNIPSQLDETDYIIVRHCKTGVEIQCVLYHNDNVDISFTHDYKNNDYECIEYIGDEFLIEFHKIFEKGCIYGRKRTNIIYRVNVTLPPITLLHEQNICPICLGEIDITMCEVLQCSHVFHTKCLWEYCKSLKCIRKKPDYCSNCAHDDIHNNINVITCPLCRQSHKYHFAFLT